MEKSTSLTSQQLKQVQVLRLEQQLIKQNERQILDISALFKQGFSMEFSGNLRNGNIKNNNYARSVFDGEKVGMIVNTVEGTVRFSIEDTDYGVAFENLDFQNYEFYPGVTIYGLSRELKLISGFIENI